MAAQAVNAWLLAESGATRSVLEFRGRVMDAFPSHVDILSRYVFDIFAYSKQHVGDCGPSTALAALGGLRPPDNPASTAMEHEAYRTLYMYYNHGACIHCGHTTRTTVTSIHVNLVNVLAVNTVAREVPWDGQKAKQLKIIFLLFCRFQRTCSERLLIASKTRPRRTPQG